MCCWGAGLAGSQGVARKPPHAPERPARSDRLQGEPEALAGSERSPGVGGTLMRHEVTAAHTLLFVLLAPALLLPLGLPEVPFSAFPSNPEVSPRPQNSPDPFPFPSQPLAHPLPKTHPRLSSPRSEQLCAKNPCLPSRATAGAFVPSKRACLLAKC